MRHQQPQINAEDLAIIRKLQERWKTFLHNMGSAQKLQVHTMIELAAVGGLGIAHDNFTYQLTLADQSILVVNQLNGNVVENFFYGANAIASESALVQALEENVIEFAVADNFTYPSNVTDQNIPTSLSDSDEHSLENNPVENTGSFNHQDLSLSPQSFEGSSELSQTEANYGLSTITSEVEASYGPATITNKTEASYSYSTISNIDENENSIGSELITNTDGAEAAVIPLTSSTQLVETTEPQPQMADPEILTVPDAQVVNEDTTLIINGMSISDTDVSGGDLETTLSVSNGTITLSSTTGLTFFDGDDGATSMTFTGTLTNVNTAITNLTYQGNTDFNGIDNLNISVNDGSALVNNKNIAIMVSAVNDAPALSVPGAQTVNEDTAFVINGTTVSDIDVSGDDLEVTLSVNDGTITLVSTTGLNFSSGNDGSENMVFTGTLANINTAIATLTYQGNTDFNGADSLSISVNDQGNTGFGGALVDSDSIAITVNAVNDAPTLNVPSAQATNEDTALVINGTTIADVDASDNDLAVTLSVTDGTITLASTAGLNFSAGSDTQASMTFTGTLANINTAIVSLTYQGDADFNGTDTLNIFVSDQGNTGSGGVLMDNDSIAITVNAVNDAPTLSVPGTQVVDEDTALVINGTTISDVDVAAGDLEITLSVDNGTITLASTTGLNFSDGDDGQTNMTFTGSLTNINNAIATLTYQSDIGFGGLDALNISVDDKGNTGGGYLVDNDNIVIAVNTVNDAPVLNIPGAQAINEDTALVINGSNISDVDAFGNDLEVILSVSNGAITLASTTGLNFSNGGDGQANMTFTGSLSNINTAIASLTYQG
ncbi:MAG: hypothetical protein V3V61_01410, partial [Gammaproteobacteria bacterium]